MTIAAYFLLLAIMPPHLGRYVAHDGSLVRRPHTYKRHPNAGTQWTATCRDGAVSFSHAHQGACSHHGGVQSWHE